MPLRVKSVAFGCDTVNRPVYPQNIHRTLWINCLRTRPRWHSRPVRRKRDQTACKPGSVPPPLPGTRRSFLWTDPRGPVLATYPDPSALRQAYPPSPRLRRARDPYSVLLLAGLAMPSLLPATRWALTPPFHPSRSEERRFAFCGAIPGVAPGGRYPPPCRRGARTFLDPREGRDRPAV